MGRSVISGHWVACVFLQSPETLEIISVRKEGEWTLEERRFVEQQSFEFGNNVSENGMPLPALTVESVFTALDGYQRCDYVDEKTRWFLSKGFVQQTHDRSTTQENFEASRAGWPENWNRRKWLLQIAQIHDLDANVMADHPYYEERSSGHPSATMVLQSTPRENQIAKSFLSKIQNFVIMEKKEGVVNLSWSFLGDISRRTRCSSPRRTTFTAAFNIVSKVGAGDGTYDMCLGGESLEQLIKPISGLAMSQLDDHDDVFVYTCDICHECEGCLDDAEICFAGMGPRVQMRVTSVQENE